MPKAKKRTPRDRTKAAAAALAQSTTGKARVFRDKTKSAPRADPEIDDGIEEYEEGKA